MSALTNVVFSLLYANSGRSLFEIASAITAHPVVARKIRKIKRHPQVTLVTRFVATASDFVKAHVPEVFSAISIPVLGFLFFSFLFVKLITFLFRQSTLQCL